MIGRFFRRLAKVAVVRGATLSPILSWRMKGIRETGNVTILNLHRVSEDTGSTYSPLPPSLFRELLRFVVQNYQPTTFTELRRVATIAKKPLLVLSFDDGYRDFIDVAIPIAEEFGVLLNQNVIPGCIESALPPLNVLAQDFVGQAPRSMLRELEVPGFDMRIDRTHRSEFGIALSRFLKNRPKSEQSEFFNCLVPQFYRLDSFRPAEMMTLKQVREIAGRHEIGVHSFEHASMSHESLDYFVDDFERCRTYFHTNFNRSIEIYAFPNGEYTNAQVDYLKKQGVPNILLVGEKFSHHDDDVWHRITLHASSAAEVRFRATGALAKIRRNLT